jgi:hypothetical protein
VPISEPDRLRLFADSNTLSLFLEGDDCRLLWTGDRNSFLLTATGLAKCLLKVSSGEMYDPQPGLTLEETHRRLLTEVRGEEVEWEAVVSEIIGTVTVECMPQGRGASVKFNVESIDPELREGAMVFVDRALALRFAVVLNELVGRVTCGEPDNFGFIELVLESQ